MIASLDLWGASGATPEIPGLEAVLSLARTASDDDLDLIAAAYLGAAHDLGRYGALVRFIERHGPVGRAWYSFCSDMGAGLARRGAPYGARAALYDAATAATLDFLGLTEDARRLALPLVASGLRHGR